MLLPFLNDAKKGVRAGYLAIVFAGFILSLTVAMTISVLGVDIAERSLFPLLATIGKASISDFIQRPDIFVVMTLIIGVFFKISIYFYAALVGISNIFNIPHQKLIYPLTLIILASTAWLTRSTSEHLMKGSKVLYLVDPIFYIVLPLVVLIAAMVYKLITRLRAGTGAASGAGGGGTASGGGTGAEASSRAGDETAGGGAGTGGAAGS
ncbi:Spore germination protein [compost metagenome]